MIKGGWGAFCCFLSTFNSWRIQWLFGFLPFYQGKGWINATIELSYMEPPQVLFISLSFWKWHTLTKGTYARVKAHFSRRQYLLACFLAQHMSDVCVRPLSVSVVAGGIIHEKIYTWHDTRHWKLWKWLWQKEVVKTHFKRLQHISLSTVCCVRSSWHYTHTQTLRFWVRMIRGF